MGNKVVAIPLLVFLTLACMLQPTASSAHVVSPGAWIRGVMGPQPESAHLNTQGIAWVDGAEVRVFPEHRSFIKGIGFLVTGNGYAQVALLKNDVQEVASKKLTGASEYFRLEEWVEIPGEKRTTFTLRIGYRGKPGDRVPKVSPQFALQILLDSPGHGDDQKLDVSADTFFPGGGTIELK